MRLESLDPRVKRLPQVAPGIVQKAALDQLPTFEVFVCPREGKPFQHEGAVHAADRELAFILAKETFTRRFTCTGLAVADTRDVFVSPFTEGDANVYDLPGERPAETPGAAEPFEVFHLLKRGKQHIHFAQVMARTPEDALYQAGLLFNGSACNAWAIPARTMRFNTDEEKMLWQTLPEKKFRDAAFYKGGEKLKNFIERTQ